MARENQGNRRNVTITNICHDTDEARGQFGLSKALLPFRLCYVWSFPGNGSGDLTLCHGVEELTSTHNLRAAPRSGKMFGVAGKSGSRSTWNLETLLKWKAQGKKSPCVQFGALDR